MIITFEILSTEYGVDGKLHSVLDIGWNFILVAGMASASWFIERNPKKYGKEAFQIDLYFSTCQKKARGYAKSYQSFWAKTFSAP